jgi:rare lipoprotein A
MRAAILVCFVAILLVGCGGLVRTGSSSDAAPSRSIDVSNIPDVIPRQEEVVRAGNYSPYTVLGGTYEVMETSRGYRETGLASWYGSKFHGRLTSNGEIYDMYQITAAHKTLPIPAYVLVRNLDNNREIIVRVNDRGPFHEDRIIDLSWAAASKLGYADHGVARVEVIALDPNDYQITLASLAAERNPQIDDSPAISLVAPEPSHLQIAALSTAESARDLADSVSLLTEIKVEVFLPQSGETFYRVLAGPIDGSSDLAVLQALLELNGLPPGYLINIDRSSYVNCDTASAAISGRSYDANSDKEAC